MATRRARSLTKKSAELAFAVPQVMAHRLTRMALAGDKPSARDRKEFKLMVAEKQTAFAEAWQAMALQTLRANQELATSFFTALWSPATWRNPAPKKMATQMRNASLGILDKGMAPVHRKAVANSKRLARTKLR